MVFQIERKSFFYTPFSSCRSELIVPTRKVFAGIKHEASARTWHTLVFELFRGDVFMDVVFYFLDFIIFGQSQAVSP